MKQMKYKKFIYHQKNVNKLFVFEDYFNRSIKMEYQKSKNLFGNIPWYFGNILWYSTLTWSENFVLIHMITWAADLNTDPAVEEIRIPTNTTFNITNIKLYLPVVVLSTKDYNKLLEQLKTGFKRTVKWNK